MALIVATYEYDDPKLRQLTAPRHDAEDLADVLRDASIGGFEVTTLINEPHRTVGEAIGNFYTEARPNDLTLLYFSGHGLKDDNSKLYLAIKDTRLDNKLFTSVTADQIDQSVTDSASNQKILILDCCYAGAFPSGTLTKADDTVHVLEKFGGRGRIVLTAADATQFAFEGDTLRGSAPQSIFTRHLIAGLSDGSADRDHDGDITIDELYDYVHQKVTEERPQQRPKKDASVSGKTVIAHNINWSLPPYVQIALDNPLSDIKLQALQYLDHYFLIGNQAVRRNIYKSVEVLRDNQDSRRVEEAASTWLDEHPIASDSRPGDAVPRSQPPTTTPEPEPPQDSLPPKADQPQEQAAEGKSLWYRRRSTLMVAAAIVVLVAAAAAVLAVLPHGRGPIEGTRATTVLPPGALDCPTTSEPSGGYTKSAVGTSVTTCAFAEQVRLAYGRSGSPSSTPRQINAYSPAKDQSVSMTCAANGPLVTCTGGRDAIVYVY